RRPHLVGGAELRRRHLVLARLVGVLAALEDLAHLIDARVLCLRDASNQQRNSHHDRSAHGNLPIASIYAPGDESRPGKRYHPTVRRVTLLILLAACRTASPVPAPAPPAPPAAPPLPPPLLRLVDPPAGPGPGAAYPQVAARVF